MRPHCRHVVTVYGEKPPYFQNRDYYDAIGLVAMGLSEERGRPIFFKNRLREVGTAMMDITAPDEAFAQELAQKLQALEKYQRVEVKSETVDLDAVRDRN